MARPKPLRPEGAAVKKPARKKPTPIKAKIAPVGEVDEPVIAKPEEAPKRRIISAEVVTSRWSSAKRREQEEWARVEPPVVAELKGVHLEDDSLEYKNLQGIQWHGSYISNVNFDFSDMRWNNFTGCDPKALMTCSFDGTNLHESISASGKPIPSQALNPWD